MSTNKIILNFLNKYPQYNLNDYTIELKENCRYDGDGEICIWSKSGDIDKYEYVGCWWYVETNMINGGIYFEKEEEVKVMSMQVCVDSPIYLGDAYYNYDENDPRYYTDIEDAVIKKYTEDHLESVKRTICEKIMSGEISIKIYSNDSDCWDAPLSQIKIYNV